MSEKGNPEEPRSWTTMAGGEQHGEPLMGPDPEPGSFIMKPPDQQTGQEPTALDEMETHPWEVEPSTRIVRPVNRYIQQEVVEGWSLAPGVSPENLCLPVAFYSLIESMGYSDLYARDPFRFVVTVQSFIRKPGDASGWPRNAVSAVVRGTFKGIRVVSWQYGKNTSESLSENNLRGMHETDYLHTQEEEDYFREHIVGPDPEVGRDIADIVRDGTPVLVTVKAGFASNGDDHAVIINGWDKNGVHVVDPDGRYTGDGNYSEEWVRKHLTGACTVIIPLNASASESSRQ